MKFVEASAISEDRFREYLAEWHAGNEKIVPMSTDIADKSFSKWREETIAFRDEKTVPDWFVRSETFFLCEDNGYILGAANIRYALNDNLMKSGGHIGYGIRPSERSKGYAFIILKLALDKLASGGVKKALLTVSRYNRDSKNVIKKAHGVLENSYEKDGDVIERYWISL